MKRQWKGFISGILVTLLMFGVIGTAMAAGRQAQATLNYPGIKVTLDGRAVIPTDAAGAVIEPFTIDGTTYLPVRGIASALGLLVEWDQSTQTVKLSKGGTQPPASQAPVAPSGNYNRSNPAPIGTIQSVNVDNYIEKYNASAVVLESVRGNDAWKMIKAANPFNSLPPEGKEYIVAKIRVSLNSIADDKATSFSEYSFTAFNKDNVEYKVEFVVAPSPSLSGSVYQGGTMEGYAVYCVDKADTAPKLVFGAQYDGSGGIWFSLT